MNSIRTISLEKVKEKPKVGRPKFVPDTTVVQCVENLAGRGLTKEQIASYLGISYDTLNQRSKEYPDFSAAIKRGKAKAIRFVTGKLFELIECGNVTAITLASVY